ncbi:uncharacterized protein LOC126251834 [Schistocerca nitens]|uniref:uncharacterized protein LOC126251834 n=1 Tax=Schistocerca nitens TaxID=7011 RepID=UPI0021176110|nr:uncharacterized protein LOC126251834 [Schistocerca nitens]
MENRNLDSGQQDIMKSPARKILGDIKNVNEDPPSPVSPTANLKLLTRVASHFRKRDFGEDCAGLLEQKVDSNDYDENVDSLSEYRKKVSAAIKSRKEKSLSLLCDKFLELFPLEVPPDSNLFISLDQAAAQLHTERRRLYDIINVLESLQMASKIGKNSYQWFGNQQLLTTLAELKGMAEEMGYQKKVKAMQKLCYCSPRYQEKELPLTPNSQQADGNRDERSLGVLCQKFLMLFLVSDEGDLVNLEVAARVVLAGSESETASDMEDVIPLHVGMGMGSTQLKAKARRLYDIANVLSSLKLIQKVHCSDSVRKPAFTYCGPKVEPLKHLTSLGKNPLYPTRHSLLRSQRVVPSIEERAKIMIGGGKRKLKRTYSDSVLLPFSECQEFQESGVDNSADGECFGEAVLTLHLVDNKATRFSSAESVQTEDQNNTSRVFTPYMATGAGGVSKSIVGATHVGGAVTCEKEAIVQCTDPISQVTNRCQIGAEPHGNKLIRHHSESCVGKTSICVKRRLVKVAPLSMHKSSSMEHNSPEHAASIHKSFTKAPQKSELMAQQASCVQPATNLNHSVLVPYAAPTNSCTDGLYIVDNPCIKTSDAVRPSNDSFVTNDQNKITSSPVISTIVMPTVNQPRIILTEEMLRNGRRLINIPGKSDSFSSKRQLLPKGINNEQRVFLQSPPVAAKNTDYIPYQPKWKLPYVKNDSHIVTKDFFSEVNKRSSFVTQNKCSYSVVTGNDINGHSRLHLSPNIDVKCDFVQKETGTVVGQSSVDNKHYTTLMYSGEQGNYNANQKQFSQYMSVVSDDHCYNRQGDKSSLQTADCTSGLAGEEKIVLPHVVPGELYTAVKVGSVLQLVPVSSNSLVTKI